MSRYPGTQFKVYDNSQVTAIVPINSVNPSDAVQYLSTFASVKGPEGITLSYGGNFYDKYGTQDNIDFKKYGQPLLQTSMNINNGAAILGKRVVLDDATLGNATLAVVLTKFKPANIAVDSNNSNLIKSITFKDDDNQDIECKYSLAPMVFSIENTNNFENALKQVEEHKERYDIYKDYIADVVANDDTPDNRFLSKILKDTDNAGVLSGFTQSVYYDENENIIDVTSEGTSRVRSVKNITTGLGIQDKKTYSSIFEVSDILDDETVSYGAVTYNTDPIYQQPKKAAKEGQTPKGYTVMMYWPTAVEETSGGGAVTGYTVTKGNWITWTNKPPIIKSDGSDGIIDNSEKDYRFIDPTNPSYKEVAINIDITRIIGSVRELNKIYSSDWDTEEYITSGKPIVALVLQSYDETAGLMTYKNKNEFYEKVIITKASAAGYKKNTASDATDETYWVKAESFKAQSEYADAEAAALDGYVENTASDATTNTYWVKYIYEAVTEFVCTDIEAADAAETEGYSKNGENPTDEEYWIKTNGAWVDTDDFISIFGYDNTVRFVNDLMVKRSGYIVSEWVFPMFTIFDNGRGESIKSISIEYDTTVASTMKKAVYKLSIYNYATSKKLESFSFSLNPYTRNNSTGYTFDIESAINYKSNQILVKQYYDHYDALLEVIQNILGTNDNDILGTYDILFGHTLNGKYKAYSSYAVSSLIKKSSYVYDYSRLDIFNNDAITVNAYCDEDNMNDVSETFVKYYYYNWVRSNTNLLERLEFGSDGFITTRQSNATSSEKVNIPFIILDDTDPSIVTMSSKGERGETMASILSATGYKNGTIISASDTNNASASLTDKPVIQDNFVRAKVAVLGLYVDANTKTPVPDDFKNGIADGTEVNYPKHIAEAGAEPQIKDNTCYIVKYTTDINGDGKWILSSCGIMPGTKCRAANNVFFSDDSDYIDKNEYIVEAFAYAKAHNNDYAIIATLPIEDTDRFYILTDVYIPVTAEKVYQNHYARFFNGDFDKDIFNLDVYFPNAIFDANYDNSVKLAIQRLVSYRGDLMAYMDMGIGNVRSYSDCEAIIPSMESGLDLTADTAEYAYVRDMHIAVTCLYYKTRNPYNNKVIEVTATYGLSNLYIKHYMNSPGDVFAGISNGITLNEIVRGSVNYIPKIYPTSEMTSLTNIGGVYPSDDSTIVNEKQLMCDLKVNYGCYYDDRFSIETEYTLHPADSEFSYWNNVALVCAMMQSIRKACPAARYQFITADDLGVYREAVETAMKPWKNKFAYLNFKYVQDATALENKIFYAAIEVAFKPFAQAEIFELTALNYSTLSSNVMTI